MRISASGRRAWSATEPARHSRQPRSLFFSPSRFFASRRRSFEPRVGFVFLRTFGLFAAIDTSVLSRAMHASRLSACERVE